MKKATMYLMTVLIGLSAFAQVQRKVPATVNSNTTTENATPRNSNESTRKDSGKEMMKALDLSRQQKIKLKEIHQNNKAKKEAIMDDEKLSEGERKIKLRELHKERANSIQDILNEEQKAKMKELKKEMIKRKMNDPGRPAKGVTALPGESTAKPPAGQ